MLRGARFPPHNLAPLAAGAGMLGGSGLGGGEIWPNLAPLSMHSPNVEGMLGTQGCQVGRG